MLVSSTVWLIRAALALLVVSENPLSLAAEPAPPQHAAARIGFERNLREALMTYTGGMNDDDWSRPLEDAFDGAASARIELQVEAKGSGRWKIEIKSGQRVALSVASDTLDDGAQSQSYWSQEIKAEDYPSITVTGARAGLKFSIPAVVKVNHTFTPHVFVDGDQREPALEIANASIRTAAQAVGSLRFMRKSRNPARRGYFGCTATLVGSGLLLTAAHCTADTVSGERLTLAEFEMYSERRPTSGNKILGVSTKPADIQLGEGLDYAFLRLASASPQLPTLRLSQAAVKQDAALLLLQDSIEEVSGVPAKKVSSKGCRCVTESIGPNFVHACDAINTSSGGPLLRADGVIVGIHVGGMASAARSENYGLTVHTIVEDMQLTGFGEKVGRELTFVP
jgi:V8-like Glu-specific endopeptidase